jgi:hypothetical protein
MPSEKYAPFFACGEADEDAVNEVAIKLIEYYADQRESLDKECIGKKNATKGKPDAQQAWQKFFNWAVYTEKLFLRSTEIDGDFEVAGLRAFIRNKKGSWKKVKERPSGAEGLEEGSFDARLLQVTQRLIIDAGSNGGYLRAGCIYSIGI